MKCIYCGFENPEMSKFCGKCGKTFGGEKTSEKQKEKGQPSYKKFLPVVGVLVILLLGYWVIAPKTNDVTKILESTPTSSDTTNAKTSESSTPLPASKSTARTASGTPTKATSASKTISLLPESKESAGMSGGTSINCCGPFYYVGDTFNGLNDQSYLSYDMTGIPANATIADATLYFSDYSRSGDPFSYLGCMGVYEQDFGVPDAKDFFLGTPTDVIAKWCSDIELSSPLKSKNMASAFQKKLGKNRFQMRLQFDKNTDNNNQGDYIEVRSPKIIVAYTVP